MPGIGHLGVGLAAKSFVPKAPLGVLLVATEATDILWGLSTLTRRECLINATHSLFTSAVLSLAGGLAGARVYRDPRTGAVIGLVILSHWALDFIVWEDTLPLLFEGSPKVGLGLYRAGPGGHQVKMSLPVVAMELGLPLLGLGVYLGTRGMCRVIGKRPKPIMPAVDAGIIPARLNWIKPHVRSEI